LSDTMTEGVIVTWEKQVGDKVKRGDIVATVETDKAVMDVEVFRDGYLSGPVAPVDATVAVGDAIGYIVESAAEVSQDTAAPSAAPGAAPVQYAEKPVAMAEAEAAPAASSAAAPAGAVHT